MNDANDVTANNPAARAETSANAPARPGTPAAARSKSPLKVLIPIGLMVAVIFGVTFFSQYTPVTDDTKGGSGNGARKEPPLRFFSSTRHWDPPNLAYRDLLSGLSYEGLPLSAPSALPIAAEEPFKFSLQDRAFPGFYEVHGDAVGPKNSTSFWFENPHEKPVILQLREVSCTACSGGKLAPIPPAVTRQLLQMSGISALPQGFVTGLPLGMAVPAAQLSPDRLEWQTHSFRDNPHATYKIPPADKADGWAPQWGILKLEFSLGAIGPKPLSALFTAAVEGTQLAETNKFEIFSEGVPAFDLSVGNIDVGELSENSEPRRFEVVAYSATRGPNRTGAGEPGDLNAPTASVRMPVTQGGEPGPFVSISEPKRVAEADLPSIARDIFVQTKRPARVESAYRYTVSLTPRVGDARIDIGLLERDIWFALGTAERHLRVKGMVRGSVWLDDNQTDITMPSIPLSTGGSKQFRLVTAQRDLDVKVVPAECRPQYLQIGLEKDPKPPSGDRGYYLLTVAIPGRGQSTQVKTGSYSGEIMLEVKGATTQRVRIPLKGSVTPR